MKKNEPGRDFQKSPEIVSEQAEDRLANEIIAQKLIKQFGRELIAAKVAPAEVEKVENFLSAITDIQERLALLSWPYFLRKKMFAEFSGQSGAEIISALKKNLQALALLNGALPKIGFHTSGATIKSQQDKRGNWFWDLKGQDIFDSAKGPEACVSERFSHLYHERKSDKLYLVRIPNDRGLYNADQGWHRGNRFSIIGALATEKVYQELKAAQQKNIAA